MQRRRLHPLERLAHPRQRRRLEAVGAGDWQQVGHFNHPRGHAFDFLAEGRVARRQRAAQRIHDRRRCGHGDEKIQQEPRLPQAGDDQRKNDVDQTRQAPVEQDARQLFHGLHITQHLRLQHPGALPGVIADGQVLKPPAQGGPQLGLRRAGGATERPRIGVVERNVLHQDHQQHQRVDPEFPRRVPAGLGDEVHDVGCDRGHEPHGAVLDDEAQQRDRQLPALAPVKIEQRAQRVLAREPVFQRMAVVAGPGGHVQPHFAKRMARPREGNAETGDRRFDRQERWRAG